MSSELGRRQGSFLRRPAFHDRPPPARGGLRGRRAFAARGRSRRGDTSLLTLGAGAAIAVGALCLSYAALVLLARNMDPAGAWAIVGAFWGLVGLIYFAATSRRRG